MLRFSCGAGKICSTIKKSQNIMNMIVDLLVLGHGLKGKKERIIKICEVLQGTPKSFDWFKLMPENFKYK